MAYFRAQWHGWQLQSDGCQRRLRLNPRGVTRGILCYRAGWGPCPSREEFPWVASGTKRVAFSILLKVRMRSRLLTARRVRCSLTVQRGKQTLPPSLSSSLVPSVGQSHLDAFHIYFIVRKRTLCPGICFCFALFLISLCTILLCSDGQVPGGWQCPQRHQQRDSDRVSFFLLLPSPREISFETV